MVDEEEADILHTIEEEDRAITDADLHHTLLVLVADLLFALILDHLEEEEAIEIVEETHAVQEEVHTEEESPQREAQEVVQEVLVQGVAQEVVAQEVVQEVVQELVQGVVAQTEIEAQEDHHVDQALGEVPAQPL